MHAHTKQRNTSPFRSSAAAAIFLVAVAALHLVGSQTVEAGIAVSPLQQRIVVKPGREAEFSLTVRNVKRSSRTRAASVKVELMDFAVSLQGNLSFGEGCEHARSAVKWITLDASELVLQPGESREIKAKVSAPSGADGDYWATFMVTIGGPRKEKKGTVSVVFRTASGVFVHVARRNYLERLSVGNLQVALPQFGPEDSAPAEPDREDASGVAPNKEVLTVSGEVTNTGVVSLVPSVRAFIYLDGQRKVASIPLHAHRRRILPGHTRRFVGVMPSALPAGHYTLKLLIDSGGRTSRKARAELAGFDIGPELARRWKERELDEGPQGLRVEPEELRATVTPGRFTALRVAVGNSGDATMSVRCRLNLETLPEGWLALRPEEFTLGPAMRRSVVCRIETPRDAPIGEYNGIVLVEADIAGLVEGAKAELRKMPIQVVIAR